MALPTSLKLFIDTINGVAYPSFNSNSAISNPVFYAGDKAKLEIYLIQPTDNPNYPKAELPYDAGLTIKAAVGNIDADPTSGTFTVSYGGDTTSELSYNATASSLAAALNSLASITSAGGITVALNAGNYVITFNQVGARGLLTTDPSKLIPVSAASVIELQAGDATHAAIYAIHVQQTVVAYTNTFTPLSAAAASVSEISAWNGSTVTYRLVINPDPKDGTYILSYNSVGNVNTSSIAIAVDAPSLELQNGLARAELDNKVLVNQVGAYSWDLTISLEPDGGLSVDSSGIISYTGWVGELNFNTAHVIGLLNSAESVEAHLEVEITAAAKPLTVLQLGCTIKSSVIDEAAVEPLVLDTYLTLSQADSNYVKKDEHGYFEGDIEVFGGLTGRTYITGNYLGTNTDGNVINLNSNFTAAWITFNDGTNQYSAGLPLSTGGTMGDAASITIGNNDEGDSKVYINKGSVLVSGDAGNYNTSIGTSVITMDEDAESGLLTINANPNNGIQCIQTNGLNYRYALNYSEVKGRNEDNLEWSLSFNGLSLPSGAIKIYAAGAELVELGSWGLGVSDTNGGSGGNTTELVPTGVYPTTAVDVNGDSYSSHLTSSELSLGFSTNYEPMDYFKINQSGLHFPDGTTQVSAFTSNTYAPLASPTFTGDPKAPTPLTNDNDTSIATTAYVQAQNYAKLTGATYSGKITVTAGSTTAPLNLGSNVTPSGGAAGDLWIATSNLSWKDSGGTTRVAAGTSLGNNFTQNQTITVTSAGSPALTVIQNGNGGAVLVQNPTGTGYSFKVEDSTTPDATPFTVDAAGRVGIGITPDATAALAVDAGGIKFNGSSAQVSPFLPPPSDGNYYVYRNGAWLAATIHTQGGKNYLTV